MSSENKQRNAPAVF